MGHVKAWRYFVAVMLAGVEECAVGFLWVEDVTKYPAMSGQFPTTNSHFGSRISIVPRLRSPDLNKHLSPLHFFFSM